MSGQTQRGQSPEGQTRPSEVRTLRARQDPAWSKSSGQDKTQRGQSPEGQTRPSVDKGQRARQDPARSKARVPAGQSASQPNLALTVFSGPRASRSSSLGRGVGPVFRLCAPSFSSLFCRFSVLVSREFSGSRRCAVATSSIRGVSRGGCAASPCSGKVPPDSRGQWHQELRAPTQEPSIFSGIPYTLYSFTGGISMFWVFGSLLNQP